MRLARVLVSGFLLASAAPAMSGAEDDAVGQMPDGAPADQTERSWSWGRAGMPLGGRIHQPMPPGEVPPIPMVDGSVNFGAPQPAALEQAILNLANPSDQAQLSDIYAQLGAIQDPAEQQRLQQLLDQRLQAFQAMSDVPVAPMEENPAAGLYHPEPEPSADELAPQVETVMVGPDASVDDLRAVDRLVQAIARLEDPIRREELLDRLRQREREAEQAAAAFNETPRR